MHFTKMEALGNDYVYVNCLENKIDRPDKAAIMVSNRHTGIGSDGLILIKPSDIADFRMDIYNADGSRAQMCGNGIRCVGKYVFDRKLIDRNTLTIETLAGIRKLELDTVDGVVRYVTVDMGIPKIENLRMDRFCGANEDLIKVDVGNPHAVVIAKCVDDCDMNVMNTVLGLPDFPYGANVEFVQVLDRSSVRMRVWERGSGETMACGTGACAVAAACMRMGFTEGCVTVKMHGGDLDIRSDADGRMYMTGPAREVFDGYIDLEGNA